MQAPYNANANIIWHLRSKYYVLRPLQSSLSIHLVLTPTLGDKYYFIIIIFNQSLILYTSLYTWDKYYYSHFTDEKTEVLRG